MTIFVWLAALIGYNTFLPLLEHNFKFLVLLPLEASEKIEALKQYSGVTHDGQLVVRGVETEYPDELLIFTNTSV